MAWEGSELLKKRKKGGVFDDYNPLGPKSAMDEMLSVETLMKPVDPRVCALAICSKMGLNVDLNSKLEQEIKRSGTPAKGTPFEKAIRVFERIFSRNPDLEKKIIQDHKDRLLSDYFFDSEQELKEAWGEDFWKKNFDIDIWKYMYKKIHDDLSEIARPFGGEVGGGGHRNVLGEGGMILAASFDGPQQIIVGSLLRHLKSKKDPLVKSFPAGKLGVKTIAKKILPALRKRLFRPSKDRK